MESYREEVVRNSFMSGLNRLISITNPGVNKLLRWKQSEQEEKWARKAVLILYKKLRKQKGAIGELERALSFPGIFSECVTIPISLDARIQIDHRKALPHFIYCRIFRWPDLQSHHKLRAVDGCQYSYSTKSKNKVLCVNPYHYERIEENVLPPILVSKHDTTSTHSLHPFQQVVESSKPHNVCSTRNGSDATPMSPYSISPNDSYSERTLPNNLQWVDGNAGEIQSTFFNPSGNFINNKNLTRVKPIVYQEQPSWASISYYELKTRVGQTFRVYETSVLVDGFTNPMENSSRLCLGLLNNVNRNSTIENTRKNIGKGVQFCYTNGEVYVECLSDRAVFVQSRMCNYQQNFLPSTVCKLTNGMSMQIFNNVRVAELLTECVYCGFEAVYELTKMCTIRLSFVKGWGANYHRQDITSTPCWIEIHLHNPLKWLDRILVEMGGPRSAITSVS